MQLGVTGCGVLVSNARRRIARQVTAAARRASSQGSALRAAICIASGKIPQQTAYVVESSLVIGFPSTDQTLYQQLPASVTKLTNPPSNLRSASHLDFWRPDPGQLPMNIVFCEKGILPRMQRNMSCCLIATVSAGAQKHAACYLGRSLF
jgi:hypothetical protein